MTNTGYDFLIEKLTARLVETPTDYNIDMLSAWLSGYAQCQHDVLDIIEELKRGNTRP